MKRLAMPHIDPFHCFPGQHADERVVVFARHHWLFDSAVFLRFAVWIILPILALLGLILLDVPLTTAARSILIILYAWYALILLIAFYIKWLQTYLDYIVITTERVIDVNQMGIFEQQVAETSLTEIQDVSCHIPGFFGEMLGYGDLTIQTAAEKSLFAAHHIPHPMEVRAKILGVRDRYAERLQSQAFEEAFQYKGDKGDASGSAPLPPKAPRA